MKGKDIHKQIESILDDLTPAEELERTHQRICQYLAQADETYQLNHITFIQELEYKIENIVNKMRQDNDWWRNVTSSWNDRNS